MSDWIWPWWRLETLTKKSWQSFEYVERKLAERGFDLQTKGEIAKDRQEICEDILNTCAKGQWVVLLVNSDALLRQIERVVPITYALTFQRSVDCITTDELLSLFRQKQPTDVFASDPAGEQIEALEKSRLLVWSQADVPANGASRYASAFNSFLSFRIDKKYPLIVSAIYQGSGAVSQNVVDAFFDRITQNLGDAVSYKIQEYGKIHNYWIKADSGISITKRAI